MDVLLYKKCMSDESTSLTRRTDTTNVSAESGEFMLSKDEEALIEELHKETGYYRTPTDESLEDPLDLASIDVVQTRSLDTHARLIIDIEDDGYTLKLFNNSVEPYKRKYFSYVFLNGKQIEVRDGGLELFDVSITFYRTHSGEFVASLWS